MTGSLRDFDDKFVRFFTEKKHSARVFLLVPALVWQGNMPVLRVCVHLAGVFFKKQGLARLREQSQDTRPAVGLKARGLCQGGQPGFL